MCVSNETILRLFGLSRKYSSCIGTEIGYVRMLKSFEVLFKDVLGTLCNCKHLWVIILQVGA